MHGAQPSGPPGVLAEEAGARPEPPHARPLSEHSALTCRRLCDRCRGMVCAALAGVCVYRIFGAIRRKLVTWLASGEGEGRLVMYTFLFLLNFKQWEYTACFEHFLLEYS